VPITAGAVQVPSLQGMAPVDLLGLFDGGRLPGA
jgi:hypothetical protein